MLKLIIIWAITALFTFNSLFFIFNSSLNFSSYMMIIINVLLIAYAIFYKKIDPLLNTTIGKIFTTMFFVGAALFFGLMVFIAISGNKNTVTNNEKAIIVLGAGLNGEEVSGVLSARLKKTLELHHKNPNAFIVVTGGQGPGEAIPEAIAMYRWLVEHGVSMSLIIIEDRSTSTEENITFALELLQKNGIGKSDPIAIVTNNFHCFRSAQYAKAIGCEKIHTAPAPTTIISVVPCLMREVFALVYMWIFKMPAYK